MVTTFPGLQNYSVCGCTQRHCLGDLSFPLEHFLWSSRTIIKARLSGLAPTWSSGMSLHACKVPATAPSMRGVLNNSCILRTLWARVSRGRKQEATSWHRFLPTRYPLSEGSAESLPCGQNYHRAPSYPPLAVGLSKALYSVGPRGTHTTPQGRGSHLALPARTEQKGWVPVGHWWVVL